MERFVEEDILNHSALALLIEERTETFELKNQEMELKLKELEKARNENFKKRERRKFQKAKEEREIRSRELSKIP